MQLMVFLSPEENSSLHQLSISTSLTLYTHPKIVFYQYQHVNKALQKGRELAAPLMLD